MAHTDPTRRLIEIARSFHTAMVVTNRPEGGCHARPMGIARISDNGDVWFATSRDAGRVDELAADSDVAVIMQGRLRYVSLTGRARVLTDVTMAKRLWHETWRPWFPGGPEDPDLALMHVHTVRGEYWDLTGARGLRYVVEAVKHAASRTRMPDASADGRHGEVTFATA
jgi:general stress protein 26